MPHAVLPVGVALLVTIALCGVASESAGAGRATVVLSPQRGQKVSTAPLWVRVRAARAEALSVQLNGRPIGGEFSASQRGVRSLQVSASYGLQYGVNLLRARVGRGRTATVRFRVRSDGPLAGAGLDRRVAAGDEVVLDGRSSRRAGRAGRARLRYRWDVLHVPRLSRVPVDPSRTAANRAAPRVPGLGDGATARPRLLTDAPGLYTLKLTVRSGRKTGVDFVDVRADPPPVAYVSTSVRMGDIYGVRVDGPGATAAFYPGEPKQKWLQIVVLKRSDLTEVSNTNYDCPAADLGHGDTVPKECVDRVRAALQKLPDCTAAKPAECTIVIAVSQPTINGDPLSQAPVGLFQALGPRLGVRPWAWWDDGSVHRGTFSAIGVPGRPQDEVQHVAADQNQPGTASISGSLVRDNDGNYGFVAAPRSFSTEATGSDALHNVVEIAGRRFVQARPAGGRGGFQVVVADPDSLQGKSYWFETSGVPDQAAAFKALQDLDTLLKKVNADGAQPFSKPALVVVASRGIPRIAPVAGVGPHNVLWSNVATQIERLGGTRTAFLSVMDPALAHEDRLASYTLLGRAASAFGSGEETTGPGTATGPGANGSPITGTVARRAAYYAYAPETPVLAGAGSGDDGPNGAAQLTQLAVAPPSHWPDAGKPGVSAAIKWLGQVVLGTDEPRSQYWTLPYSATRWSEIAASFAKQTYPPKAAFTAQDLATAQAELDREIGWLITTHEYTAELAAPFQRSAIASWADLQSIAANIAGRVGISPEAKVRAQANAVFDFARKSAKELPLIGKVFAFSDEVYDFAAEIAKIQGEAADSEFAVKVGEAGKQLAERLTSTQDFLDGQLPNAIASDYTSLKTVGTCASVVREEFKDCPDHAAWEYTQDDQREAARVVRSGASIAAYGTLLPAKYRLYRLPQHWRTSANTGFGGIELFACHKPFADEPATGQFAKPIFRSTTSDRSQDIYELYALGFTTGDGTVTSPYLMNVPKASVTDALFGTGDAQLGADPETFFARFFQPERLLDYPEQGLTPDWYSECGD